MDDPRKQFVLSLLAYAVQKDVSPGQLCRLAGIDLAALQQGREVRITPKQFNDLWLNASHLSNDPLFGLHFGESLQLAALGVVGQIVQSSRTVSEALGHAAKFIGLITHLFGMEVRHGRKTFTIRFLPQGTGAKDYPATFRHMMDLALVFVLHELDGLILKKIKPLQASFPMAADDAEYERVLRCKPRKKAGDYVLEFDAQYWNEPILTANYAWQRMLLQKVAEMNPVSTGATLREKISGYLLANAYLGIPTLEALAANFNTSARSLQRRLREEGVTYQQLADGIRKSLALHYLQAGHYPVKEISFLLGYNELSAFTRAFKRWTGTSPVRYQRR